MSDKPPASPERPPQPSSPSAAPSPPPNPVPPPAPAPVQRSVAGDLGRTFLMVLGILVIFIGLWFFAKETLAMDLPELEWKELWPILVLALGAWVVLVARSRRR